jgi:hypothetical protein
VDGYRSYKRLKNKNAYYLHTGCAITTNFINRLDEFFITAALGAAAGQNERISANAAHSQSQLKKI